MKDLQQSIILTEEGRARVAAYMAETEALLKGLRPSQIAARQQQRRDLARARLAALTGPSTRNASPKDH